MNPPPARDVVTDYHRAWTSGRVEDAMSLVAEDVTCRAPGVDLVGIEAFDRLSFGPPDGGAR
ncbi:nuclear transport factor 2 family protein [Georgenia wutianyii]|uniref:Nuclear transport factor 2 family protein n=1 Tax=Georgenia wutianyii TaxID=2585135 RepID=A0ABX5VQP2_9MICO|nr:nuclear transport factor 2 family protein [Georgenia wutianyii]QDB79748.1 nuclear transport factor 2 family protein [Georgenia wutianyii]